MMKKIIILLIIGVLMFGLFGCAKKYSVNYCGQKVWYNGAKDSYKAGETVHLEYAPIATDTNYNFLINIDSFSCNYESRINGYVIEFVMPEHDVNVDCQFENSMTYNGN